MRTHAPRRDRDFECTALSGNRRKVVLESPGANRSRRARKRTSGARRENVPEIGLPDARRDGARRDTLARTGRFAAVVEREIIAPNIDPSTRRVSGAPMPVRPAGASRPTLG